MKIPSANAAGEDHGRTGGRTGTRFRTLMAIDAASVPEVLTEPLRSRLAAVADVSAAQVTGPFLDDPVVAAALAGAEVLLTGWGCPPITPEVVAGAPRLRAIVHSAGTVKHLIDPCVFDRGVVVSSAAAANAVPVAEFTVAAIVLSGKRAFRLRDQYRRQRGRRDLQAVHTLGNHGTIVGVVGASRIGRLVLERLRSLDVEVLVSDPFLSADEAAELGARLCDLETLFRDSDVVTLHAPLLPETTGLVDSRLLSLLRDGTVLINTARGALVDQAALERECVSGRIDAVIDVTDPEPLPAWSSSRRADGLTSVMVGLHGYDDAGVWRDVDANAFGPHSATPYLLHHSHPGRPLVQVAAVVLSGDTVWPQALADSIAVEVDGHRVGLSFADGTTAVVRLGADVGEGWRCIVRPVGGHEEVVRDG